MVRETRKNLDDLLLSPDATIREALQALSRSSFQIIFTANELKQVIGCITDGDVRRAFLRGETLETPVSRVARKEFIFARKGIKAVELKSLFRKHGVRQIPVLDTEGKLLQVKFLEDLLRDGALDFPVVIMAGGRGTRLLPYTQTVPKPLLKVGDQTIIERLVAHLQSKGIKDFYVTVNYLAEQVMEHLGDGSRFGCQIHYVHEKKALGTGGSLSLIRNRLKTDFLVFNCDVMASVDLKLLADFHREHEATATVCTKLFSVKVPYGVIQMNGSDVRTIEEKPEIAFTVNSGIYFFSSAALEYVQDDEYLDMPNLLSRLIRAGKSVKGFQSVEPWIDVGSHVDFERAQKYLDYLKG